LSTRRKKDSTSTDRTVVCDLWPTGHVPAWPAAGNHYYTLGGDAMTDEQLRIIANPDSERLTDEELKSMAWILNELAKDKAPE